MSKWLLRKSSDKVTIIKDTDTALVRVIAIYTHEIVRYRGGRIPGRYIKLALEKMDSQEDPEKAIKKILSLKVGERLRINRR